MRLPRLLLFQATISSNHSFIPYYVEEPRVKLDCGGFPEYALVFVISRTNMDEIQYQNPLSVKRQPLASDQGQNIPQYALAFTYDMFSHLSECVQRIAVEMRVADVVGATDEKKAGLLLA